VVAFFIMALAAAEAAIGLAIVVSIYRVNRKIDLATIDELRN
jgi:NADH-quinone oxidoreductase subunit K